MLSSAALYFFWWPGQIFLFLSILFEHYCLFTWTSTTVEPWILVNDGPLIRLLKSTFPEHAAKLAAKYRVHIAVKQPFLLVCINLIFFRRQMSCELFVPEVRGSRNCSVCRKSLRQVDRLCIFLHLSWVKNNSCYLSQFLLSQQMCFSYFSRKFVQFWTYLLSYFKDK